jgi:hypothetical protein
MKSSPGYESLPRSSEEFIAFSYLLDDRWVQALQQPLGFLNRTMTYDLLHGEPGKFPKDKLCKECDSFSHQKGKA